MSMQDYIDEQLSLFRSAYEIMKNTPVVEREDDFL